MTQEQYKVNIAYLKENHIKLIGEGIEYLATLQNVCDGMPY